MILRSRVLAVTFGSLLGLGLSQLLVVKLYATEVLLTVTTPNQNSFNFDINLEGVGIFLGILISLSILGNFVIKLIINATIKHEIAKLIDEHENLYHKGLEDRITRLDRRVFELRSRIGDEPDSSVL